MKLPRRRFLHLIAGAAAFPAALQIARAQAYPSRPVRIIVPFPAGTSADIFARLMGQWLSERLDQPFVTENRPGAGSNLATEAVVRAPPDGYTLLWTTSANATANSFNQNLNFNFIRDIAPVAGIFRTFFVLAVNPSVPAKTLSEFIAYAKASPGRINVATGGVGTPLHLAAELFKMMAHVEIVPVHYRGDAPALADLIGGQVQAMFVGSAALDHIRAGKLRALAVTTKTRWEALPDVPTVDDTLPGYEASGWQGLGAPRNTPAEIIARLNSEANAGLADSKIRMRYADLGVAPLGGSPAEFAKLIAGDTEKWAEVIRSAHIKAE